MEIIRKTLKGAVVALLFTTAACGSAHKDQIVDATTKDSGQTGVAPPTPPTGGCRSDADCNQGETCDQGVCGVTPPNKQGEGGACTTSDDCDTGLVCTSGVCQKPADSNKNPALLDPSILGKIKMTPSGNTGILKGFEITPDTTAPQVAQYWYHPEGDTIDIGFSEPVKCDLLKEKGAFVISSSDVDLDPKLTDDCSSGKVSDAHFQLATKPTPDIDYTFTVKADHVVDMSGNKMPADKTWSHNFKSAELGLGVPLVTQVTYDAASNSLSVSLSEAVTCVPLDKGISVTWAGGSIGVKPSNCLLGQKIQYTLESKPLVAIPYTIVISAAHVIDINGSQMPFDYKWTGVLVSAPTASSESPSGWALAKPNAKDFVWVPQIMGIDPNNSPQNNNYKNQPRDVGTSTCQSAVAYNSPGMMGIRLKRASNVQTTLLGDHAFDNLSAGCLDETKWQKAVGNWLFVTPTWYYDYGSLDYEAQTDAGYALDGFKIDRCRSTGVIIGLTPIEVKVSSAGVDLNSAKEVSKGKFIIDDTTSCNDRETVDYGCNVGTWFGNGILNGVTIHYLNSVAQKAAYEDYPGHLVYPPAPTNATNQAVGISITCQRVCSADEIAKKVAGCDFK